MAPLTMAETDVPFDTESSDTEKVKHKIPTPAPIKKRCNWCNRHDELFDGKPYCVKCSEKLFRECGRCHRPFPHEKYFSKNEKRCNSCQDKYLSEKMKREQKKLKQVKNDSSSEDDDNAPQVKKIKRSHRKIEPQKVIFRNKRKKYLVIYETDECPE